MVVPGGQPLTRSIEREATIAVVLFAGDTARAWFESLRLTETSSDGTESLGTDAVLRQPFLLGFDARGRTTLEHAQPPIEIARLTNSSVPSGGRKPQGTLKWNDYSHSIYVLSSSIDTS